jgi:SAM-dependent methyltransferase
MSERSEASYIVHDVIPLFARYGYPSAGDRDHVKVNDVPVFRPSGGRSGSTMDIVYYYSGEPVLLVEAKRENRSHEKALGEAENYLRNFPVKDNKYAPSGRPPRYIATTVGREIKFYHHRFEVSEDGLLRQISEPVNILTFDELLEQYGLVKGYKAKPLGPELFRKEFLNVLVAVYNTAQDRRITPEVIKNVSWHILNYLGNQKTYINRYPYTELDNELFRQEHIKDLHRRFDLINSLCPEIAEQFRSFILRAFQGTALNQYLTEQCVIAFMFDLIGTFNPDWKMLDFECGSGGFLAAAAKKGTPIENMLGIDIDELPFIVAKTYLALYFKKAGKTEIEQIPVRQANGLFFVGDDWNLVVGNPAGSAKYERDDIDEVLNNLESDLDQDGRSDKFSEYNFSVQQAVRSCKIGGKICLVLPEGIFSNSQDEFLRKYIARHCRVLAIVSLPRGVFKKGTSTRTVNSGSQTASMKMSILYAEKTSPIIDGEGIELDEAEIGYPVFLANISPPESTSGDVCGWLEPRLNLVLEEWKKWQIENHLSALDESLLKDAYESANITQAKKKLSKKDDKQIPLSLEEPVQTKKRKPVKSEVSISKALDELFKKK